MKRKNLKKSNKQIKFQSMMRETEKYKFDIISKKSQKS